MAKAAFQFADELHVIHCCNCGVVFAFPESLNTRLVETHRVFFCPNGHEQLYKGETEAEKLKKELEKERQRRTMAENTATAEAQRASNLEATLTRERKRVGNGVCPCCNRSFSNLRRHMATKHPEHQGAA